MTTKKKLLNVKGISEAKVDKIKEAIGKVCVSFNQTNQRIFLPTKVFFLKCLPKITKSHKRSPSYSLKVSAPLNRKNLRASIFSLNSKKFEQPLIISCLHFVFLDLKISLKNFILDPALLLAPLLFSCSLYKVHSRCNFLASASKFQTMVLNIKLNFLLFHFQTSGFLTAFEYSEKRKECFRIPTGSAEFE